MALEIRNFPHAEYNFEERLGYLCEYYAYPLGHQIITMAQWRNESWSGRVLDYKDGADGDIQFFLNPYSLLVKHVMQSHDAEYAYVVPVPGSIPATHPDYRRAPKTQAGESRDDRNDVFCQLLDNANARLIAAPIINRVERKPKKARWSAEQHAESMRIQENGVDISDGSIIVLVDDVTTLGGTMDGARQLLSTEFEPSQIVVLPIAKTCYAHDFRSIN